MLERIVSGGQTGGDQAGLFIARKLGFKTGGTAPKNFMTANGPQNILLKSYGLKEMSLGGYKERTWKNVEDSDGTMRFCIDFQSPGEICTLNAIKHFGKPYIDFDLSQKSPNYTDYVEWLIFNHIQILNVAGNRQRKNFDVFKWACFHFEIILKSYLEIMGDKNVLSKTDENR